MVCDSCSLPNVGPSHHPTLLSTTMITLIYVLGAANYAQSFSLPAPSIGFHSIKSWDDISEPWDKAGRRYGPNWSIDENNEPVQTPGQTGAMVWSIPFNSTYVYPEMRPDLPVGAQLRSRPNLGICMSGGGMRAATCALGWYRGLNHLNLLQKARYVSANSGATWTSLPLSCRSLLQKKETGKDINLDDWLGKYEGKYDDHATTHEEKSIIGKNLVEADMLNPSFNTTIAGFNAWSNGTFRISKQCISASIDLVLTKMPNSKCYLKTQPLMSSF